MSTTPRHQGKSFQSQKCKLGTCYSTVKEFLPFNDVFSSPRLQQNKSGTWFSHLPSWRGQRSQLVWGCLRYLITRNSFNKADCPEKCTIIWASDDHELLRQGSICQGSRPMPPSLWLPLWHMSHRCPSSRWLHIELFPHAILRESLEALVTTKQYQAQPVNQIPRVTKIAERTCQRTTALHAVQLPDLCSVVLRSAQGTSDRLWPVGTALEQLKATHLDNWSRLAPAGPVAVSENKVYSTWPLKIFKILQNYDKPLDL